MIPESTWERVWSQWSLTFEVRKRETFRLRAGRGEVVAMEPDL